MGFLCRLLYVYQFGRIRDPLGLLSMFRPLKLFIDQQYLAKKRCPKGVEKILWAGSWVSHKHGTIQWTSKHKIRSSYPGLVPKMCALFRAVQNLSAIQVNLLVSNQPFQATRGWMQCSSRAIMIRNMITKSLEPT